MITLVAGGRFGHPEAIEELLAYVIKMKSPFLGGAIIDLSGDRMAAGFVADAFCRLAVTHPGI